MVTVGLCIWLREGGSVGGFPAGLSDVSSTFGFHARTTGSSGRRRIEYPAALTEGGKRSSGLSFLGFAVPPDSPSVEKVVYEVRKVSLDTCGRTPGGGGKYEVWVAVVGAYGGQKREHINQERSNSRQQLVIVVRAVDPQLPQYVRGDLVANSVSVLFCAILSQVVVSVHGKQTPFHRSRRRQQLEHLLEMCGRSLYPIPDFGAVGA